MKTIECTLKNFSFISELNTIFPDTCNYMYTSKGVIRSVEKPICKCCGKRSVRNGWDTLQRKNLFFLKIGKFYCPNCNNTIRSDLTFWENFIAEWESTISAFFLRLSDRDVALRVISEIMDFLNPMSKDSVMRRIFGALQNIVFDTVKNKYQIVHYDEQHPKKGRQQYYRLTLLDAMSKKVIADELFGDKSSDTIKTFLTKNLDTDKETIIITDDYPWYPEVFKEVFGNKVKHQLCILHLNKLVFKDCRKVKSLQDMYNTYLLLNIFFDRSSELDFLNKLMMEEKKGIRWIVEARRRFNKFVRDNEKERRRNKQNHKIHSYEDAKKNFDKLWNEKNLLPKVLQKRLLYIKDRWERFTVFYKTDDCPHTNNVIENYFSTSLKTHRKKQFRTKKGLTMKMKLSACKRNTGFAKPVRTFFEWGKIFYLLGS